MMRTDHACPQRKEPNESRIRLVPEIAPVVTERNSGHLLAKKTPQRSLGGEQCVFTEQTQTQSFYLRNLFFVLWFQNMLRKGGDTMLSPPTEQYLQCMCSTEDRLNDEARKRILSSCDDGRWLVDA